MLLYPYTPDSFKPLQNPLNLQSWELLPHTLPHLLSQLSSILLILPSLPVSFHPIPLFTSRAWVCRIPTDAWNPLPYSFLQCSIFSIFILIYLITAIPLSISFIPSPHVHPRVQSCLGPLAFSPSIRLPVHLFNKSNLMYFTVFPKLPKQTCFVSSWGGGQIFHTTILPSICRSISSLIHPRRLLVSH